MNSAICIMKRTHRISYFMFPLLVSEPWFFFQFFFNYCTRFFFDHPSAFILSSCPLSIMSEIVETKTNALLDDSVSNPLHHIGDLRNLHQSYRLNGQNYLKWSQLVGTYLKGKENF